MQNLGCRMSEKVPKTLEIVRAEQYPRALPALHCIVLTITGDFVQVDKSNLHTFSLLIKTSENS